MDGGLVYRKSGEGDDREVAGFKKKGREEERVGRMKGQLNQG